MGENEVARVCGAEYQRKGNYTERKLKINEVPSAFYAYGVKLHETA